MNAALLFVALLTALPAVAQNTTLFQDNFSTPGTKLDLSKWTTETVPCASFLGRTQLADWVTPGGVGQFVVSTQGAQLALNTFNPTGNSLYGTHGKTLTSFRPTGDTTIVMTTRAQLTSLQPGIVYGMYFFHIPVPCTTFHDEIDIELVANMLQSGTPTILLNRYANEPLGAGNAVAVNAPAGFNALAAHDWTIRWSLSKIDYLVDGTLLFSATTHVPQGSMEAHLITWGPDAAGWPDAYSASLQVANNAGQNQRFYALLNSVTVTSSAGNEIGYVDTADNGSGSSTIVKGAGLFVGGWAADTIGGAPVQNVTLYLDGNFLGNATLGGLRSDVAQVFSRSDFLTSGWGFGLVTSNLTLGPHSITATATGISGTGPLAGTKVVNIVQSPVMGQTIGFVDTAGDASGSPSVVKGSPLVVNGWAADSVNGAPVLSVTVFVDGFNVGPATLGIARPDIAQHFGSASFLNSGWSFQLSTNTLSLGSHTVTAMANGLSGTAQLVGSKTVTVTITGQEIGVVDSAGDSNGGLSVVQGGTLFARGWAADTASGAPVQTVTVFIDGINRGTATLGIPRPDVAAFYSRSDYTNSGWTFQMSTGALSVGNHTVTAKASGPSGTVTLVGNKSFLVTSPQPTQVLGYLDAASAQGSTVTLQGWAADTTTGAPVQNVSIIVDGSFTVNATLGIPRPDVALVLGRSDFLNSGWTAQVNFVSAVGSHSFTASATGMSGTAPLVGVKIITFP